jgi:tRNA nucleotidyltransferase (CCA-adding enzyme)
MAAAILARLRAPTAFAQRVEKLVRHHDATLSPEPKQVRRWLYRLGEADFRAVLAIRRADIRAQAPRYLERNLALMDEAERGMEAVLAENPCLSLQELAVKGDDLLRAGFAPGKNLGDTLRRLLEMVVDGDIINEKDALLATAREFRGVE